MGLFSKNTIFGLDIGFESFKLVELRKSGRNFELVGSIDTPLTEKILEKDKFRNKAAMANAIKEACKKAKPYPIRATQIVTALPETFVFSKTIKMPKMKDIEYAKAIEAEAASYLPIPVSEVYIDYQILTVHPDEPLVDILFVAAPKNLVDDYVQMSHMAGFELLALETKPQAVGRAIIGQAELKDRAAAVVEIGTEITRVAIWEDNHMRLTSSVSTGANSIKEALGLTSVGGKIKESDIPLVSSAMSLIIDEIINAIRYHQNRNYQPKPIGEVLLCGSGARFSGIEKLIEKELKIKTKIVMPLVNNAKLGTEFVTAIGLAMWEDV